MRKERGITLVALVITIVVLLILAGVAITALTGDNNIIGKAKEAKEKQEEASANEEDVIKQYSNYIDDNIKVEDAVSKTYYVYNPDYYNETFILNGDGTVGGTFIESYWFDDKTKDWRWDANAAGDITIVYLGQAGSQGEEISWEECRMGLNIFNVGSGKVLQMEATFFVSNLDIIKDFTYLKEGTYVCDGEENTISSTTIGEYKFGLWTNSDGTVPYFTDGDVVINQYGDIYHMKGENSFEDDQGRVFEYQEN